jgi:phytoene synthase
VTTGSEVAASAAEAIRKGSKSFAAAARLFDRETRESAILLYAWCRHCDDVVDGQALGHSTGEGSPADVASRLATLEAQTRAALDGAPTREPAFAGLATVVRRHAIPERYPLQHLDGFRMDVAGRRYETAADTLDYCYHVAGVVGVMMGHVMGVRDPATLDRACDLGLAFQLTNMARDLVEDAEVGRVYLPTVWLTEAGVPPGRLAAPEHRQRLAGLAARLLDVAEPYYASAAIGIRALPPRAAWAIATARGVYRQIGLEIRERGAAAWDTRVSTSPAQKVRHVGLGGVEALMSRAQNPRAIPGRAGLYERPG